MFKKFTTMRRDLKQNRHCLDWELAFQAEVIDGVTEAVHACEEIEEQSRSRL
jgi:hypothetical protein